MGFRPEPAPPMTNSSSLAAPRWKSEIVPKHWDLWKTSRVAPRRCVRNLSLHRMVPAPLRGREASAP